LAQAILAQAILAQAILAQAILAQGHLRPLSQAITSDLQPCVATPP